MTEEPAHDDGVRPLLRKFDQRLTELIHAVYPDEQQRPGYARLAREISAATGGSISGTYLWELATGKKRNITLEQLDVLAQFFGVPPEYFLNEEVSQRVQAQLALATALRDAKVRSLAMRASGLSPASLDSLLTIVNETRKVQNLPEVDPQGGGRRRRSRRGDDGQAVEDALLPENEER
ncbi:MULTISPECIES: hypothetical protein [Streptomyces]|uniref:HTH cro/C1-type domain-containing protein n=1 Tax=Streptomyces venezuelae (strain ATCC 10712 / CBS 650.69 / DSM 40230 / JCM 4526 / NBRC 13096 / PD 04745) TaxID=953739 RepID=F2RB70_STRVP|nr:hypothetical protein [Streptomyces venezuelae]APE20316.1 hypothetical protein vnz_04395 [Streptomyces venezuelae]CCA54198.1 hypothetical protein SVEN_0911 [Streptomyces venezuelae ATCC 10712]